MFMNLQSTDSCATKQKTWNLESSQKAFQGEETPQNHFLSTGKQIY